jgi:hypothetical protein
MLTSIQFRSSGRFPGSSLKFTVTRERRIGISATSSSPFRCVLFESFSGRIVCASDYWSSFVGAGIFNGHEERVVVFAVVC